MTLSKREARASEYAMHEDRLAGAVWVLRELKGMRRELRRGIREGEDLAEQMARTEAAIFRTEAEWMWLKEWLKTHEGWR